MKYPTDRKGRHWSHRVVRLLMKTCASHAIGSHGVNLVVCITHTEDAKHYSDHVTYFNDDLQRVLGIRKWDTLAKVRGACVDSGWLHYEAGGTHKAGIYWSLIPPEFAQIDDLPTDEGLSGEDLQRQSYAAGYRDGKAGRPMLYPGHGDNHGDNSGDNHGDNSGDNHGDNRGEHSTLPLTLSLSCPPSSDDPKVGNGKPKTKPTEESPEFIAWYAAFPRREGRGYARTAYAKAITKLKSELDPHRKLLDAVAKYSSHVAARERNHIKTPAAWLNGEHWTDELDSKPASGRRSEAIATQAYMDGLK